MSDIPVPENLAVYRDEHGVLRLREKTALDERTVTVLPGTHLYVDPDTGEETWVTGPGPVNVLGEPIGWWGVDPDTSTVTWHPRAWRPGQWHLDKKGHLVKEP